MLRYLAALSALAALASCGGDRALDGAPARVVSARAPSPPFSHEGLLVPLYVYPSGSGLDPWDQVMAQKQAHPNVPIVLIADAGNGSGSSQDPNYASIMSQEQTAGVTVISYVFTSYGARAQATVEQDILNQENFYHPNGVFLDEMADVTGYETYYKNLTAYAHGLGLHVVVGNPGTNVPESYFKTVDDLVLYEKAGYPGPTTIDTFGKSKYYFSAIPGAVPFGKAAIRQLAKTVGLIYPTDGPEPETYSSLPSYFNQLVALLAK